MAIVGTLPNIISDGQLVDAVPVMADFTWIVNQVNANAAQDSGVVHLAGTEAITGAKTFSGAVAFTGAVPTITNTVVGAQALIVENQSNANGAYASIAAKNDTGATFGLNKIGSVNGAGVAGWNEILSTDANPIVVFQNGAQRWTWNANVAGTFQTFAGAVSVQVQNADLGAGSSSLFQAFNQAGNYLALQKNSVAGGDASLIYTSAGALKLGAASSTPWQIDTNNVWSNPGLTQPKASLSSSVARTTAGAYGTYTSTDFSRGGCTVSAAAGTIQVPVAGTYLVSALLYTRIGTGGGSAQTYLTKNGSTLSSSPQAGVTTVSGAANDVMQTSVNLSCILELAANDVIGCSLTSISGASSQSGVSNFQVTLLF